MSSWFHSAGVALCTPPPVGWDKHFRVLPLHYHSRLGLPNFDNHSDILLLYRHSVHQRTTLPVSSLPELCAPLAKQINIVLESAISVSPASHNTLFCFDSGSSRTAKHRSLRHAFVHGLMQNAAAHRRYVMLNDIDRVLQKIGESVPSLNVWQRGVW